MIFFTSDTHFGHENIIKYCNRPFSSAKEMDECLINNWNGVVSDSDTVYILGDFLKNGDCQIINDYLKRLNGEKYLILGNHDEYIKDNSCKLDFKGVYDYKEITIQDKVSLL